MTFLEKLQLEFLNSRLPFLAHHPPTEQLFISHVKELQIEIQRSKKRGATTDRFFELLEILTYQLFEIHGFKRFRSIYAEEAGWIKTEVKNTLNYCLWAAADI